jgi:aminopeptidase 2
MTGYYKSVWDHDGKKDYYSLTQFEVAPAISIRPFTPLIISTQATYARRAFPCWDEPLLKATFSVTMISRANTVNLSNMPIASEEVYSTGTDPADNPLASSLAALSIGEVNDQWKITRFEKSPPVCIIPV